MPATLDQITKEAMDLPPHQKLALAGFLLESAAAAAADPEAEAAWEAEIRDRIAAVEQGRAVGVSYEEVMRAAEARLLP
jgi:putative addiction module component (TIGR02574 family)